ncbi:MAG: hypothetical protein KKG64_02255 [Firmicutes bacterium]|nr:hypothetical protein [Bacillota bacterium]
MKSNHVSRLIVSIVMILMAITSSTLFAYAYFENNEDYGFVLQTGDFEITAYISFDGESIDLNSPFYDVNEDVLLINAFDEDSENYIGKLKVDIAVHPNIAARVRLKLLDEWELVRTYIEQNPDYPIDPIVETVYHTAKGAEYHPFSLLKVGVGYSPIYDSNGYAYLAEVLPKDEITTIHFIDGGDSYPTRENEIYYETCLINLRMIIDVVQANRYADIWSIDPSFFGE